jgi:hypothetical protein
MPLPPGLATWLGDKLGGIAIRRNALRPSTAPLEKNSNRVRGMARRRRKPTVGVDAETVIQVRGG